MQDRRGQVLVDNLSDFQWIMEKLLFIEQLLKEKGFSDLPLDR